MSVNIFVLLDCTDHEGCCPLLAFEHEEAAKAFKVMAEAYDEKKPRGPDCMDESDGCYAQWSEYETAIDEWSNNHPVRKDFSGADYYSIAEIPYRSVRCG